MLKATIEIWPHGWAEQRRTVGELEIGLQGYDNKGVGTYISTIKTDGKGPQPENEVVLVEHDRALGPFSLVKECLSKHLG